MGRGDSEAVGLLTDRPKMLLAGIISVSAVLSALLANDIVCLAFPPLLCDALLDARKDPVPYLLALATSSNIGSAATIIGNPQNMYIGTVAGGGVMLECGPRETVLLLLPVTDPSVYLDVPDLPAALGRLTPDEQGLLALRFGRELTVPEIAAQLRIPEGTVKSRLHSTYQHLRAALDAERRSAEAIR